MNKLLRISLVLAAIWLVSGPLMYAQLPDCNYFYHHSGSTIYMYNTTNNTTSINTITMPAGAGGLAVSNNLNAAFPPVTFYTTIGATYYYYNGSTWVSTGHNTGNASAVNIGGAGPYIYNLNGLGQQVYRYDGTGPGVLVLNLPGWGGPFDCIGDAAGNFYILKTNTPPYTLTMYSPSGAVICVYDLVGFPTSTAGGGYAIVNNTLYATIGGTPCYGTISGNTITYQGGLTLGGGASDYANCEFPPLVVSIAIPSNLTCANPTAVLNASTSLTNPTWSWAGPGVVSGGTTATPTVNMPGTYTVTVTSTSGCTNSATATCTVVQTGGITVSANTTNIPCFGASTGSIDITPSNGATPYTFVWSNGPTTEDQTGIPAGTYTVNVTDNSGCTVTASYTLTQPATGITLNTNSSPALCGANDGSASVVAAGGTGAYTYSWAPIGGTAATANNLGAGTYTVTVTDANLCTQTASVTVTSTSAVNISSSIVMDVTCIGGSDGAISVSAGGGVFPYTYVWSNGGNNAAITNLTAGTYTVTATDGSGCTVSGTFTVNPGAPLPAVDLVGDVLSGCVVHCVNFSIPANIPTGSLQAYQWQVNGATVGNIAGINHCFGTAGMYDISLIVTDTLGCVNSITKTAYVDVQDFPVADFITDKTFYFLSDAQVHVTDQSYNATNLFWDMNDGSTYTGVTDFTHQYADTGVFCIQLIASSALNCTDTAVHCITIKPESSYYIPNSFTPNGDGLNDTFHPVAANIYGYTMIIFDRWGREIFTSGKDDDEWNGHIKGTNEMAPQGVYVYKIVIEDSQHKQHEFTGQVNMIR